MSDYRIVNSIEKYDVVTDTWISLYFKLPMPLSKHSAVGIDQKTILIFGGMSADFEPVTNVWSLDLNIAKFTLKRSMQYARLCDGGQGAFKSSNGSIYLLNGCLDAFECEKYKTDKNFWELLPSYATTTNNELINAYVGALIKAD